MPSPRRTLLVTAVLRLSSPVDAFQTNIASQVLLHQQPSPPNTLLNESRLGKECDDYPLYVGRRQFLKQLSIVSTGTLVSPLLLPDEEVKANADVDDQAPTTNKDAIIDEVDAKSTPGNVEVETETSTAEKSELGVITTADEESTLDKVETLIKDESELDAEVLKEEADEKKSIEDEEQLIEELTKEIAIEESDTSTPEDIAREAAKVKDETEALIKEEEQLKSETEDMIVKIETMESEVKSLETLKSTDIGDSNTKSETPSEAFVKELKERVVEKEDLITRLKRESQKDIDPKTGKFKVMTEKDYKDRVKSNAREDSEGFIKFLKDTVANEKEWERDLEAFEGMLEKEFSPAIKELKKDLKPLAAEVEKDLGPLVGEAEKELLKEVSPIGDAMENLKQSVESAVEGEVSDLEHRAEELIGKIRSIF